MMWIKHDRTLREVTKGTLVYEEVDVFLGGCDAPGCVWRSKWRDTMAQARRDNTKHTKDAHQKQLSLFEV
jgi:hypothetical protein